MRVLWFNWRDIKNPAAGGAEVFTHEVMSRLVRKGHDMTLFTAQFLGCLDYEEIDGVKIVRSGGKYSIYRRAKDYYKMKKNDYDIVVDEITDQYVAGEIKGEERERVEKYFLKSDQRQEKVKYAAALKTYQSQHSSSRKWWTTPQFRIAASIIIVVAVGIFITNRIRQSRSNAGLLALQQAYREQRPLESRIFGWNYAPAGSLRGAPKVDYIQRDRAASILQNAANEHRDATALHQLGQFYLAERQFDKAIDQLEAALALSPNDATIHSDLGTALLEKGKLHLTDSDRAQAAELFG